jgi:Lon protease-like protein
MSMGLSFVAMNQIESLPLFPLADVVLLPEISVPLRLFEPRYLQMARDVLAGSNQIGMVTVRPDCVDQMPGDPTTFDIGCLGRVVHAQEQPDGTVQILLLGMSRFRILHEEARREDRLYRSARVELLLDETPPDAEALELLEQRRRELLQYLERLVQRLGRSGAEDPAIAAFERLEPARLINALTQSLAFEPIERQRLLEANSIVARFEIMGDLLRFRLAEVAAGEPGSTSLPN